MTWRERIQAARERGRFLRADQEAFLSTDTCLAGEVVGMSLLETILTRDAAWDELWAIGSRVQSCLYGRDFDPNAVEAALEAIEDRALQLKRA
jgi:hypothetical protein